MFPGPPGLALQPQILFCPSCRRYPVTESLLLVQITPDGSGAPAMPAESLLAQVCPTSDVSVPLGSGIQTSGGLGQLLCPHQRQQEWSVLPLADGTSRHPSPDSDQLWQRGFAAFLMSNPLRLSRGNWGRRLLLCVCNWLPPWQRMRHGLISYLSEPRWVFSVARRWTGKHLRTSVAQKSESERIRCAAGSHGMDGDLAGIALSEVQGTRCALPLAMGLAQSGDTPALELGAGGACGQGLPLSLAPSACPVGSIGGPSWPTTKHKGHGARLEICLFPPPALSRCSPPHVM